jgi:hypothetical protein
MVSLFVGEMLAEYYPGDQVKKMRCVGYVAFKESRGYCWGNLKEGDWLEDQGTDGRIILSWILKYGLGGRGKV